MDERIETVLREKVRPALALHGGDVEPVGFDGGVLRVRFTGACAGCPSAYLTLEDVVAKEVCAAVPEVRQVVSEQGVSDELLDFARGLMRRGEK